ncbi:MAG: hypothetical protein JO145_02040 [Acidobacteriaceae bacterium]|nr:hypothetical protein [Acidobacteriaceae bacterium]
MGSPTLLPWVVGDKSLNVLKRLPGTIMLQTSERQANFEAVSYPVVRVTLLSREPGDEATTEKQCRDGRENNETGLYS